MDTDGKGIVMMGEDRVYKKVGSGLTVRLHNNNTRLVAEKNDGTFIGSYAYVEEIPLCTGKGIACLHENGKRSCVLSNTIK